ncbi:hypothetical protein [Mycobacterium leprae]|nr:hypothetical protein [Mycobacterium leprae]
MCTPSAVHAVIHAAGPNRVTVVFDAITASSCDYGTFLLGAV